MSGHSKWHKIKHQKAANDPKKGKVFGQMAKQIQLAAREGGPDPDMNPSLRKALDDAKAVNLPKENIQRAINKGAGIGEAGSYETVPLEGYGPGGVAVMLSAETDNRNRTIAEIRRIFKEHEGNLGEPGSAAYVFGTTPEDPQFRTLIADPSQRSLFESLIDELESHEDVLVVYHNFQGN